MRKGRTLDDLDPLDAALQWSRNLRVAESVAAIADLALARGASMEPQLEGCGKLYECFLALGKELLQWSRNLRVAERESKFALANAFTRLQWSRNLRVAERAHVVAGRQVL